MAYFQYVTGLLVILSNVEENKKKIKSKQASNNYHQILLSIWLKYVLFRAKTMNKTPLFKL